MKWNVIYIILVKIAKKAICNMSAYRKYKRMEYQTRSEIRVQWEL
jgi:hypothetical protein